MTFETKISSNPDLIQATFAAANYAYEQTAATYGAPISEMHFTKGDALCDSVSQHMAEQLTSLGYNARTTSRFVHLDPVLGIDGKPLPLLEQPADLERLGHTFCEVDVDGTPANRVVADGTWQQFLNPEKRTEDLPKVLTGTYEEVRAILIESGMDVHLLDLWHPVRKIGRFASRNTDETS